MRRLHPVVSIASGRAVVPVPSPSVPPAGGLGAGAAWSGRRAAVGVGRPGGGGDRLEVRPEHDDDVGLDDRGVLDELADAAEVALDDPALSSAPGR